MAIRVDRHGREPGNAGQSLGTAFICVTSRGEQSETHLLKIGFETERGTGKSEYDLYIESSSFRDLAEGMIRADRKEAIKAFGAALQMDIPEPMKWGRGWVPPKEPEAA